MWVWPFLSKLNFASSMNTVRRAKGAVLVCSAGGAAYYHTNSEAEQSRRRLVRERLCQRITVQHTLVDQAAQILNEHGVCILADAIPLINGDGAGDYPAEVRELLGTITYSGEALLSASGEINLHVAGALIGNLAFWPIPIPGSFVAGMFMGAEIGKHASNNIAMERPTVLGALLDPAVRECCMLRRPQPNVA